MTDPAPEANAPKTKKARRRPLRHTIAIICLVISCVLAPLAVIANFVKVELLNTDRYVATVSPLIRNSAVTDYVATRVTDQLMSSVNVQQLAEDALPSRAKFLAGGIATGIQAFVEEATKRILVSDQFAKIWDEANRQAHEQVKQALTGQSKEIKLENGMVVLDLSALLTKVRSDLSQHGIGIFDNLPIDKTSIRLELFDAKGLQQARTSVRWLVIGRVVLLVLVFLLAALGIFLAGDRRRALAGWGFGLALSLGTVAAAILFARGYALDHLSAGGIPRNAAQGVIDALLHYLRLSLRAGIALGLVVALAATLVGSGHVAITVRTMVRTAIDRSPAPEAGPFSRWVGEHRTLLRAAGLVVVLLGLLMWETPGALTVLFAALLLVIWLIAIEIVGRTTIEAAAPPG